MAINYILIRESIDLSISIYNLTRSKWLLLADEICLYLFASIKIFTC